MIDYSEESRKARLKVLELIYKAKTSHIGSNFSSIDVMTVLFDRINLNKDKFVLSKGWVAASLYYFLWKRKRLTKKELESYCLGDSKFIGLAEPIHKDIPFAGGSMGFGLPAAVGFALAKKFKNEEGKIYCLMSDGEMNEGTVWEAALIANHHKLDNLIVFVDANGYQAMGETEKVLKIRPLCQKWRAFGWKAITIDGHDYSQIEKALQNRGPIMIVAKTIKGKGVDFMENNNLWHYAQIKDEDYKQAKKCLTS